MDGLTCSQCGVMILFSEDMGCDDGFGGVVCRECTEETRAEDGDR